METGEIDEIRANMIKDARARGMTAAKARENQGSQWLVIGLERLERGVEVTAKDLPGIDKMGGTDHPDPTLRTVK